MHFAADIAKEYLTNKYHYELLEKFYREDIEKTKSDLLKDVSLCLKKI